MQKWIRYSCGHEDSEALYGKTASRKEKLYALEQYGLCPTCREKELEKRIQEKEARPELCLPSMTGSPRQIAWARKIRFWKIDSIVKFVDAYKRGNHGKDKNTMIDSVLKDIMSESCAKWWIDKRGVSESDLILTLAKTKEGKDVSA